MTRTIKRVSGHHLDNFSIDDSAIIVRNLTRIAFFASIQSKGRTFLTFFPASRSSTLFAGSHASHTRSVRFDHMSADRNPDHTIGRITELLLAGSSTRPRNRITYISTQTRRTAYGILFFYSRATFDQQKLTYSRPAAPPP